LLRPLSAARRIGLAAAMRSGRIDGHFLALFSESTIAMEHYPIDLYGFMRESWLFFLAI
jgi:hypothetical protein